MTSSTTSVETRRDPAFGAPRAVRRAAEVLDSPLAAGVAFDAVGADDPTGARQP